MEDIYTFKDAKLILEEMWLSLNARLFENRLLRLPRFKVVETLKFYGRFIPGKQRDTIKIAAGFFQNNREYPLEELFVTVVHEMVHQLAWENDHPLDHGAMFLETMDSIGYQSF